MEIGHCPRCVRPFTVGEVTGLGILRSRPERAGGPFVEFDCPRCSRRIRLLPHGDGRYALPGEPPPPAAPPEERVPPWIGGTSPTPPDIRTEPPPVPAPPPPPPRTSREPPQSQSGGDPRTEPVREFEDPMTPARALETLGLPPTAEVEDIERAYRERSLTCHPDKVAHLDADFQALAEAKFRNLREAYEALTDQGA